MVTISQLARDFGSRPDISARSVLVTIFGDSIVPTGGEIWLGDLIELAAPFGFSDRLVRTSMYRLTAEGWFDTERVGRRSRYHLTADAAGEFRRAEERIYSVGGPEWDGQWTLAFLASDPIERGPREQLATELRPHGFGRLGTEVLAFPGDGRDRLARAADGLRLEVPAVLTRFDDRPAGTPPIVFELEPAATRYREFVDAQASLTTSDHRRATDREAFIVRTMVVHGIRRAALSDPWLPSALLPADWPGGDARALAAANYHAVTTAAWRWLEQIAGVSPPVRHSIADQRFMLTRPITAGS